jgi:hypothetical protein
MRVRLGFLLSFIGISHCVFGQTFIRVNTFGFQNQDSKSAELISSTALSAEHYLTASLNGGIVWKENVDISTNVSTWDTKFKHAYRSDFSQLSQIGISTCHL